MAQCATQGPDGGQVPAALESGRGVVRGPVGAAGRTWRGLEVQAGIAAGAPADGRHNARTKQGPEACTVIRARASGTGDWALGSERAQGWLASYAHPGLLQATPNLQST